MIDSNLPLELDDGTPVTLVDGPRGFRSYISVRYEADSFGHPAGTIWNHYIDNGGFGGKEQDYPKLRNKTMPSTFTFDPSKAYFLRTRDGGYVAVDVKQENGSHLKGVVYSATLCNPLEADGDFFIHGHTVRHFFADGTAYDSSFSDYCLIEAVVNPARPMELEDGTPVELVSLTSAGFVDVKVLQNSPGRLGRNQTTSGVWCYFVPTGEWAGDPSKAKLRNKVERAFDPSKPVTTRDGRKARIICTDSARTNGVGPHRWPIVALVENGTRSEEPLFYLANGRACPHVETLDDLINPVERQIIRQKMKINHNASQLIPTALSRIAVGEVEFVVEEGALISATVVS